MICMQKANCISLYLKKQKKNKKETQQNPWRLGTHKAYFWQLPWIIFTIIAKIQ